MTQKEILLVNALEKEKETLTDVRDHNLAIGFLKGTIISPPNLIDNYLPILDGVTNDFDSICKKYNITD